MRLALTLKNIPSFTPLGGCVCKGGGGEAKRCSRFAGWCLPFNAVGCVVWFWECVGGMRGLVWLVSVGRLFLTSAAFCPVSSIHAALTGLTWSQCQTVKVGECSPPHLTWEPSHRPSGRIRAVPCCSIVYNAETDKSSRCARSRIRSEVPG